MPNKLQWGKGTSVTSGHLPNMDRKTKKILYEKNVYIHQRSVWGDIKETIIKERDVIAVSTATNEGTVHCAHVSHPHL